MPTLLLLCLVATLLLLLPAGHATRATVPPAGSPSPLILLHAPSPAAVSTTGAGARAALLEEPALVRRPDEAVEARADAPPPGVLDEERLLAAVRAALPLLGGDAAAAWGKPLAVGSLLRVRWLPGESVAEAEAFHEAVVAAVGVVVDTLDREFPRGFVGAQGTPLAAIEVMLPERDSVVVAIRTYRDLLAGEASLEAFRGQWRLLSSGRQPSAPAAANRRVPVVRPLPDPDSAGAPSKWPPRIARWYPELLYAGRLYGIDPALLAAIMQQESGGEPNAVGPWAWIRHIGRYERAIGMMQVMPNEAERRGVQPEDAWEPLVNIALGARVLRDKLENVRGDYWTRVQGYYGFGDPLSDYWLNRVYNYWLAFRDDAEAP